MKTALKLFFVLILSASILSVTSCIINDDYEMDENNEVNDNNNDISEGDSESSTDRITELIKRNISATVNYDDYGWNISIKSKLEKTFPNKTIIYGVESGYGSYDYYEHFKFGGDLQKSDGRGNMTICYPVFVGEEYSDGYLYFSTYKALKKRKEAGEKFTEDLSALWNTVFTYMRTYSSKAKANFCGRLYVQIDNNRYAYYRFGLIQ